MIHVLFPEEVATASHRATDWTEPLFAEEQDAMARALPKRAREFAAGRACARRALRELGASNVAIPVGQGRAPSWPPGFCGSISHCADWCGAAVAHTGEILGLGFDVESAESLEVDLIPLVCSSVEIESAQALREALAPCDPYKLIFSAKESVFKACWPLEREMLGFLDVRIEIDAGAGVFRAFRVGAGPGLAGELALHGRFVGDREHVFTGAWIVQ